MSQSSRTELPQPHWQYHRLMRRCSPDNFTLHYSNLTVAFDTECLVELKNGIQAYLANMPPTKAWVFSVLHVLISLLGILGNGLILGLYACIRRLRNRQNFLIANLAAAQLLLSLMLYPVLWVPDRDRVFPYGWVLCKFATALPAMNIYVSTGTIAVMAVDRYYSTVKTRASITLKGNSLSAGLEWEGKLAAVGIWGLAGLLSVPLVSFYDTIRTPIGWDALPTLPLGTTLAFDWEVCALGPTLTDREHQAVATVLTSVQMAFLYLIPLLLTCYFNLKLSRALALSQRDSSSSEKEIQQRLCNAGISQPDLFLRVRRKARQSGTVRCQKRLKRLLMAMGLSYAVLWLPYTLLSALIDLELLDRHTIHEHNWLDHGTKLIWKLGLFVNPLIYGFCNFNYRRELSRFSRNFANLLWSREAPAERSTAGEMDSFPLHTRSNLLNGSAGQEESSAHANQREALF